MNDDFFLDDDLREPRDRGDQPQDREEDEAANESCWSERHEREPFEAAGAQILTTSSQIVKRILLCGVTRRRAVFGGDRPALYWVGTSILACPQKTGSRLEGTDKNVCPDL